MNNEQNPKPGCTEDVAQLYEKVLALAELDTFDNGDRAANLLMEETCADCRAKLQTYLFQEYGANEANKLYEILQKSPSMQIPVDEWCQSQFSND